MLKLKLPKLQPKVVIARNYEHYQPENFLEDLAQIPWCGNLQIDDVNEKVASFDSHFLNTLKKHATIKSMKIRYRQCPFLNDEIIRNFMGNYPASLSNSHNYRRFQLTFQCNIPNFVAKFGSSLRSSKVRFRIHKPVCKAFD